LRSHSRSSSVTAERIIGATPCVAHAISRAMHGIAPTETKTKKQTAPEGAVRKFFNSPKLNGERLLAWLPVSAAKSAGLEGFENSQSFVNRTSDVEAVDNLILEVAIWIDDEQTTQCNAFVFHQYAEVAANVFGDVGSQYELDWAQSTFVFGGLDPSAVAVYAVGRDCQDFSAGFLELVVSLIERGDFSRANEREIQGVEENDQPFAFVIGQTYVLFAWESVRQFY